MTSSVTSILAGDVAEEPEDPAPADEEPEAEGGRRSRRRHRRAHGRQREKVWVMPPGLHPVWRWILGVLLVVQVGLIAFTGIFGAFKLPYFSPIDESAHYAYIQHIAEQGSLPVLGKTNTSLQALSIQRGLYPHPRTVPLGAKRGLATLSYEAFQPPLYYLAAVPVFLGTPNYIDKIYAVRLFDAALLLAAVALAGRLCRVVLKERWLIGWSMVLVFLALPGVVVRMVFISNLALGVPIAILFVTELWIAWHRGSGWRLAGAGLVLGLCVLTELELVLLVPLFVLVLVIGLWGRWTPRSSWLPLIVAVVLPLALVAPWIAFNESHFHMLTAGPIAIREQTSTVNPHHLRQPISQLPQQTASLLNPSAPVEWATTMGRQPGINYIDQLLGFLVVPAAVVLILGTGRRLWSMRAAILGLPWVLNLFELWYIRFGQQWQVDVRYMYASVPILLVLAADATDTLRSRYLPVLVTIGATAGTMVLWGYALMSYTGPYAFR